MLYKVLWCGYPPEIATWEEVSVIHAYKAGLEAGEELEGAGADDGGTQRGPMRMGVNEPCSRCEPGLTWCLRSVGVVHSTPTGPYSIIISIDFNRYMMCISGAPGPNPRV